MTLQENMLPLDLIESTSDIRLEDIPFHCRLCAEAAYRRHIILETDHFFTVPDLRSIVEGHVQIISRDHLDPHGQYMFSAGHFPKDLFAEYELIIEFMTACIENEFQRDVVWFEHGEKTINPAPGSIYHPHLIGAAIGDDIIDKIVGDGSAYFDATPFDRPLSALQEIVQTGPYYFYQGTPDEHGHRQRWILRVKTEKTPSQLIVKYMSELPDVRDANRAWLSANGAQALTGEEYLFQNFRPRDRFYDSLERLRDRAKTEAITRGCSIIVDDLGVPRLT